MQSYSQEGLSMAFPDSDFSEYQNEIDEFKRKDQEELYKPKRGRFKFIWDLQMKLYLLNIRLTLNMIQISVSGLKANQKEQEQRDVYKRQQERLIEK